MSRRPVFTNDLQARAFDALDKKMRAAAKQDAKFGGCGGEIDIGGAWLAQHDGLTGAKFKSNNRNGRRPLVDGPDLGVVPMIDVAEAGLDRIGGLDGDPLSVMLAIEEATLVVEAYGGLERAIARANLREANAAAHAKACGVGLRMAQIIIKAQRDLRKRQRDLFDDEGVGDEL
ncbi:MAG: hypothetical protein M0Z99_34225 [Betaproteobacteria bacterium]|nr:hypothetical protein [Betaproteobacteria bacterium]